MMGGKAGDDLGGNRAVIGEQRGDQRALAAFGKRHRLVGVIIGHDGRYRPEGLDIMHRLGIKRFRATKKHRAHEGAGFPASPETSDT